MHNNLLDMKLLIIFLSFIFLQAATFPEEDFCFRRAEYIGNVSEPSTNSMYDDLFEEEIYEKFDKIIDLNRQTEYAGFPPLLKGKSILYGGPCDFIYKIDETFNDNFRITSITMDEYEQVYLENSNLLPKE